MPNVVLLILFFAVFATGFTILLFQWLTGVPPMPAGAAEVADVIELLKQSGLPEKAVIYELGCGWGGMAIALARAFPDAHVHGVERSPFPFGVAWLRARGMPNMHISRRDFYRCGLQDAAAVTCYLMVEAMPKLAGFLDAALKPGTPVVSLTFAFRGRKAARVRTGPGLRGEAMLYYWPGI